jgi:hypothetical protein
MNYDTFISGGGFYYEVPEYNSEELQHIESLLVLCPSSSYYCQRYCEVVDNCGEGNLELYEYAKELIRQVEEFRSKK